MTRTKVVCTLGPSVFSYEKILALVDTGMSVARINFSHGTQEEHLVVINQLKKARAARKVPLSIMVDTKGPEIRLGVMKNDSVPVKAHQKLFISKEEITPPKIIDLIKPGMRLLFDDGYISAVVLTVTKDGFEMEVQNEGVLKSHKGVTIPNIHLDLPAVTKEDIKDMIFACENDVEMIAISFARSADQLLEVRQLLASQKKSTIVVIAKIENSLGVQNFDSILNVADGIMVARGDLGVELPLEEVPGLQKMMISRCAQVAKPVITATQMLESMTHNPRPTRAEVSDVANSISQSSNSVMLSGETAVGVYPIETMTMMKSIILASERDFFYQDFFYESTKKAFEDVSTSVARAAIQIAYGIQAKAIFVLTHSGTTARLVSRFRPQMPILALTLNEMVYHQMAFLWGVIPVKTEKADNIQESIKILSSFALHHQLVQLKDLVVVTAGLPFWIKGTTSTIIVETVLSKQ